MGLLGVAYHAVKMFTDPDKCDEHLAKAKWSIAKGLIDPIGVIDVVDVVEDKPKEIDLVEWYICNEISHCRA